MIRRLSDNSQPGRHFHWQVRLGPCRHQRKGLARLLHVRHRESRTPHNRQCLHLAWNADVVITAASCRWHFQGFGEPRRGHSEWQPQHIVIQRPRDRPRFSRLQGLDGGAALLGWRAGAVAQFRQPERDATGLILGVELHQVMGHSLHLCDLDL